MLKIYRYSAWVDGMRKYKIILDGNMIGKISDNEHLEFPITKGKHELTLKIDWCRSKTISFDKKDEDVEFECGSNLKGLKMLLAFLYAAVLFNRYIYLEQK
jgi:hypothetical protein